MPLVRPSLLVTLVAACTLLTSAACSGGDETADESELPGDEEGGAAGVDGGATGGKGGSAGASAGGTGFPLGGASGEGGEGGEAGQGGEGGEGGAAGEGGQGGEAGTGGTPGGTCEASPGELSPGAMLFDGKDAHVTMGAAKALGLSTFTVEAWVRRDGAGKELSTGVGGLRLVPIAGKGRGESDGTNVDCNYSFGFVGEKLGVDFEDADDGGNHPLVGNRNIPRKEWHHVATTYDGKEMRLYVDGKLDAKMPTTAKPRADSIQHFAIGAGLDSKGAVAGAFHGAIDEVRVWKAARTAAEIAEGANLSVVSTTNLVGRWSFDDGTASDEAAGSLDGKLVNAKPLNPGAPLDGGKPAAIKSAAPTAGATVPAASAELSVTFDDADSKAFESRFYLRQIADADDFTIVVLPDTQYYVDHDNDGKWRKHFYNQTKWIVDNRKDYNIVAVIHNGDITDTGQAYESEWKIADTAMSAIEDTAKTGLPDGIPFIMTVGNHDNKAKKGGPSITGNTGFYNKYFGIKRYSGRAYYGGHYGDRNDESFITFSAGGLDFVVVSYQYIEDDTAYRKAAMKWGRSVFDAHPDAFGIVNSHYIVGSTAKFGNQGAALYKSVSTAKNVHLMTCGHVSDEEMRTDDDGGHPITSMLADYQGRAEGGQGYMRIWEFSPRNSLLTVRTYSPSLKKWETDAKSQFTIKVDLTGSGGAFTQVKTSTVSGSTARAALSGLKPGAVYEWYAAIDDCSHTTTSPIHRFKTAP